MSIQTLFPFDIDIKLKKTGAPVATAHGIYKYGIVREGQTPYNGKKISDSSHSAEILEQLQSIYNQAQDVEAFIVLFLNRCNTPIGSLLVSKGGMTGTVADPRVIFRAAVLCGCTTIILNHNHPSGQTNPSAADIQLTRKIKEAGVLLDIQVIDHIITTGNPSHYYSFCDNGMI